MITTLCLLAAVADPQAIVADEANATAPTAVASAVAAKLERANYSVKIVPSGSLGATPLADAKLLVLADAAELPASLAPAIDGFLRNKGNLIVLRGPAWQRPLVLAEGRWQSPDAIAEKLASSKPDSTSIDFASYDPALWTRATDDPKSEAVHEIVDAPWGSKALHVAIRDLTSWDTYLSPDIPNAFPGGSTVTQFSAKGDANTSRLAVEWREKDGSRWIGVVPLTTQWRSYRLGPLDFHYWDSVPSRSGDRFHPENALRLSFGLAFSHTGTVGGKHEYWVANVGASQAGSERSATPLIPAIEGLYPAYKYFPISEPVGVAGRTLKNVRSLQPRPQGAGYDKRRGWRFVPWATATSDGGAWRGLPVATTVWTQGPYAGATVTGFGMQDASYYASTDGLALIGRIAARVQDGLWLEDGGADVYTDLPNRAIRLGATVANLGAAKTCRVAITATPDGATKPQFTASYDLNLASGETKRVEMPWHPEWSVPSYRIDAELTSGGKTVDRLAHTLYPWRPKAAAFVKAENGEFLLGGKPWRAHGVNYMPSSGIGLNDADQFEYWMDRQAYDPAVIERDLGHIEDLGFNAVSAFVYGRSVAARNLPDFLRRCERHGLKVDLSLRPGTPMDFDWNSVSSIVKTFDLANCDTVFAYDLAWEPSFGDHAARKRWDAEWESWLTKTYGSPDAAEKAWAMPVPRGDGKVTNPQDNQFVRSGPWKPVVAAYRRFLDDLLYAKYNAAAEQVRSLDKNHLISFRMAEAGNPTYDWPGSLPYDFPGLAKAVDFLAPEGYGRIGGWEKVKPGLFEVAYARAWSPLRPVVWAEAGMSTLNSSSLLSEPAQEPQRAEFYAAFYRMLRESHSNGVFWWWYPGGVRVGENSDFGILNPDGTDRPTTAVIRREGPLFLSTGPDPVPSVWLPFDRDTDPRGVFGVYESLSKPFWDAVASGRSVGLQSR